MLAAAGIEGMRIQPAPFPCKKRVKRHPIESKGSENSGLKNKNSNRPLFASENGAALPPKKQKSAWKIADFSFKA